MRKLAIPGAIAGITFVLSATALMRAAHPNDRALEAKHPLTRTVWDSVYSASQATRGESLYVKSCARCHKASLGGADESSPLVGSGFLGNWNALPLSDLSDRIRKTMPSDSVGIYDRQLVVDVMAYLLKMNGFPAGETDLPKDLDRLKDITIVATKP
ncbi:MAG: cytochrome c [Gemmatimonadaceae bacterium]